MDGPAHYTMAEKLLRRADEHDTERAALYVAAAQVHATLALAAANALLPLDSTSNMLKRGQAWREAIS